jgi:putative addiction module CopG family antidote
MLVSVALCGPALERVCAMNVTLTNDLRDFVRQKVESGEVPSEEAVLREALQVLREQDARRTETTNMEVPEDLVDHEFIAYCSREADDSATVEEVLRATSRIQDSMARVVVEDERAERF